MAFFDKTRKRIMEIERRLTREEGNVDTLRARLEELRARGPDWFVDFYDQRGIRREEKCPPEYQTKKGARKYHMLCLDRVRKGGFVPHDLRAVKLYEITAFFCDQKRRIAERSGKDRGYKTTLQVCRKIDAILGNLRLDKLDLDPEILSDIFLDFPRKDWSPKTVWNFYVTLKAAINHWIRFKRLIMKNPCDVVELDPQTKVMEYVPTREDFDRVYTASFIVGLPDYVRHLLTSVFETGLRVNEVMRWKIEELDLSEPVFGENCRLVKCPSFMVEISKQRRLTRKRIPMSQKLWEALKVQVADRQAGLVFGRSKPPYSLLKWLRCPECGARFHDNRRPYRKPGEQCTKCRKAELEKWSLAQEAGVPFFRPFHDYRKTVKWSNKVEKGLPAVVTMAFQGHASESMDAYYTHLSAQDLIPAVADSWSEWRPAGDQK